MGEFEGGDEAGLLVQAAEFLHIHNSVLLVVCRQVETGVGVELLEFDLGFEAVLGFHHHVHQFIVVIVPLFDATEVAGAAFVVDNERHDIMTQAFLEHKQSAHATVAIFKGEDLLEADVDVQNVVALDVSPFS